MSINSSITCMWILEGGERGSGEGGGEQRRQKGEGGGGRGG